MAMATMGKYCKAYLLKSEKAENARKEKQEENGQEIKVTRKLTHDAIVYLQENYVVTDGIFKDENVIFEDVTPDWIEYCQGVLEFEIPDYARAEGTEAMTQDTKEA
jgi:hypothetical protein